MILSAARIERCMALLILRRRVLFVVLVVIAAWAAIPVGSAGAQEPSAAELRDRAYNPGAPPNPEAAARGQKVYAATCAFCHGADATGGTGPNLLDVPVVLRDQNGSSLAPFLHRGLPDLGMPAFPAISMGQAADIAAFLHSQSRAAADRFAQQVAGVVTGNAAAGKAYFNGPGKCASCHSPAGDMSGIANKYTPARLMSRICYPFARTRSGNGPSVEKTAIVTLPSGREVTGTLVHQDVFNIELSGPDGSHHVYPVAGATVRIKDPLAAHVSLVRKYTDRDLHNLVAYLETLK